MKAIFSYFLILLLIPTVSLARTSIEVSFSKKEVVVNEPFTATVYVNSPDKEMNAIHGTLVVDGAVVSSIKRTNSIISFWITEPIAKNNTVPFEGVTFNPGYKGSNGLIFKATLIAKKTGTVKASFIDTVTLANDGQGTSILDGVGSGSIIVKNAPKQQTVASVTEPDTKEPASTGQLYPPYVVINEPQVINNYTLQIYFLILLLVIVFLILLVFFIVRKFLTVMSEKNSFSVIEKEMHDIEEKTTVINDELKTIKHLEDRVEELAKEIKH
jgi:hypothetical protein